MRPPFGDSAADRLERDRGIDGADADAQDIAARDDGHGSDDSLPVPKTRWRSFSRPWHDRSFLRPRPGEGRAGRRVWTWRSSRRVSCGVGRLSGAWAYALATPQRVRAGLGVSGPEDLIGSAAPGGRISRRARRPARSWPWGSSTSATILQVCDLGSTSRSMKTMRPGKARDSTSRATPPISSVARTGWPVWKRQLYQCALFHNLCQSKRQFVSETPSVRIPLAL